MGRRAVSHWRKVIDACPDRAAHLHAAISASLVAERDCFASDDWEVGIDSIARCLQHTFAMSADDVEEFRGEVDLRLQIPDWSPRSREAEPESVPPYLGGHPRIQDGEYAGLFYGIRDLEELIWSRGSELAEAPTFSVGVIRYGDDDDDDSSLESESEEADEYEGGDSDEYESEDDGWVCPMAIRLYQGSGYFTMHLLNENESWVEQVLAEWTPVNDPDAWSRALSSAYASWKALEAESYWADSAVIYMDDPKPVAKAFARPPGVSGGVQAWIRLKEMLALDGGSTRDLAAVTQDGELTWEEVTSLFRDEELRSYVVAFAGAMVKQLGASRARA